MGMFFCHHVHWYVNEDGNNSSEESFDELNNDDLNENEDGVYIDGLPSETDVGETSSEDSDSIENNSDEEMDLQLTTAGDEHLMYGDNW